MGEDGRSSSAEQIFPKEKISTEVGLITNSASGTSLESFGWLGLDNIHALVNQTQMEPTSGSGRLDGEKDGPSTTSSTSRILRELQNQIGAYDVMLGMLSLQ
ncbi:UNVERIFIED_CONTAM: hypothetical protein GTU68_020160 [Idotea baltica]|nr:hypothetical protein [Idotea baltica]